MSAAEILASYIVSCKPSDIPDDVRHEARRALLNFVGCAVGGAQEPAVEIAVGALIPFAGSRTSAVLGRLERLDPLRASLVNGISSHVLDFDDTTTGLYSHTTSPVASALFGHAGSEEVHGSELLHAFILGFEVASRLGAAVSPTHYEAGWHITGTIGVVGAAAAIGRLRRLDEIQMARAIGLAATQASGFREMFGSMGKSFHPGRAAESGFLAVELARRGYTAPASSLDGPRGYMNVLSTHHNAVRISDGIGVDFYLRANTYKPFACGVVIHPAIEAASLIRHEELEIAKNLASVDLRVSPIVIDLCNKQNISSGLESKFSVQHAAAVGLVRGRGGLAEFSDDAVNDQLIKNVRKQVTVTADPALQDEAIAVSVTCSDGRVISKSVEHPLGSLARPLSDEMLNGKFRDLTEPYLSSESIESLIEMLWDLENSRVSEIVRTATVLQADRR